MNILELQSTLDKLGIPKRWYSLNEDSKTDNLVLVNEHGLWGISIWTKKETALMGPFLEVKTRAVNIY